MGTLLVASMVFLAVAIESGFKLLAAKNEIQTLLAFRKVREESEAH